MNLAALPIANGCGAVIVYTLTGEPLPIAPSRFVDEADANAFLAWCGHDIDATHVRELSRRWARVKAWLPCPTCSEELHGRCEPGQAQCRECRDELLREGPQDAS